MPKDKDGVNFVTDNNTGGHYVCQCQGCDEVYSSRSMDGGEPNADAGDYGDSYCPHCEQVDPEECDNPNLVWNVQQKKINTLRQALGGLTGAVQGISLDERGANALHDALQAALQAMKDTDHTIHPSER